MDVCMFTCDGVGDEGGGYGHNDGQAERDTEHVGGTGPLGENRA